MRHFIKHSARSLVRMTLALCVLTAGYISAPAQETKDPVLLDIAGDPVSLTEFLRIYNKNNIKGETLTREALEEYLDLYINFKLKVREAIDLKMDTVTAFITELDGYRDQLAEPYLTDREVDEQLVMEAWERMQSDIRASHILIRLAPDAAEADRQKAFQKALDLRQRILAGEDFGTVAMEMSDDQSARDREASRMQPAMKGNRGDLGYFTVFDMIYPFESAAYNTPTGQVSDPVLTSYGYHLIQVTDRKPAMGRVRVAHIFVRNPESDAPEDQEAAEGKIREAYGKLKAGEPFEEVVMQYSEDQGSAKKGGLLSWFGVNRMVPSFIEAIADLDSIGDISEPVRTDYGWHIVRLVERKPIGTFEQEEADIRKRISKDTRSERSAASFIRKVKDQYGFSENQEALADFYKVVTDSIFFGSWDIAMATHLDKNMFTLGSSVFTQQDFARFLQDRQRNRTPMDLQAYVDEEYAQFVSSTCLEYKDQRLEQEYPEFRALMQEYHDGILLFELTEDKVWAKAGKDTTGLEAFFAEHRNDYMWGERLDATLVQVKDPAMVGKARKLAANVLKKDMPETYLSEKLNKGGKDVVELRRKKYTRDDSTLPSGISWEKGLGPVQEADGKASFYMVHGVLPVQPKELPECRGLVTADYQTYLEKQWINELRAKYPVKVNRDVLDTAVAD